MKTNYYVQLVDKNFGNSDIIASDLTREEAIQFVFVNNGSTNPKFEQYQDGFVRIWDKQTNEYILEEKVDFSKVFVYEVFIDNQINDFNRLFTSLKKALDYIKSQVNTENCDIKGVNHNGIGEIDVMESILRFKYDDLTVTKHLDPMFVGSFFSEIPSEPTRYYIKKRVLY